MNQDESYHPKTAETARDRELAGATAAMHRAARRARRRAAANGTPIAVFEDGKVVRVRVDDEAES